MSDHTFSVRRTIEVHDDRDGDTIRVSDDADGLDLVEIFDGHNNRIVMRSGQARIVSDALKELADFVDAREKDDD